MAEKWCHRDVKLASGAVQPQCCGDGVPGSEACPPISLQIIEAELRSTKRWELTAEGEEIAREGSHEARVFRSVPPEGLAQSELMVGTWGLGPREVTE